MKNIIEFAKSFGSHVLKLWLFFFPLSALWGSKYTLLQLAGISFLFSLSVIAVSVVAIRLLGRFWSN